MEPFDTTSYLVALLKSHGIACSTTADAISLTTTDISLQAIAYPRTTTAGARLQLDVLLWSPRLLGQRVLIESFAGLGTTTDEALENAFEKFTRGSFHVLLAAFVDAELGAEQVEREYWSDGVHSWTIFLGPLLLQAHYQPDEPAVPPDISSLLDQVRDRFLQEAGSDTHWIRLYCMRNQGQTVGYEALLDNETWQTAQELMDAWQWPEKPSFYALRLFLIAVPVDVS